MSLIKLINSINQLLENFTKEIIYYCKSCNKLLVYKNLNINEKYIFNEKELCLSCEESEDNFNYQINNQELDSEDFDIMDNYLYTTEIHNLS